VWGSLGTGGGNGALRQLPSFGGVLSRRFGIPLLLVQAFQGPRLPLVRRAIEDLRSRLISKVGSSWRAA